MAGLSLHRFCFALDLVDNAELIAAYEQRHEPGGVWPEVLADIRAQGVVQMEIWRVATHMVMVVDAHEDFPRPRPAEPRVEEWEAQMSGYQKPLAVAEAGQKWLPMTRIFALDQHE